MDALLTGVVAGYGIAIPVGAIAILIAEVGIRCGFRCGFFAGAGAATADLVYAGIAVISGAAIGGAIASIDRPLRIVSAIVLALIAVAGLRRVGKRQESVEIAFPDRRELAGTYARFFGLTIVNPTTIIYFAAVIVGLGVANDLSPSKGGLFVAGAFLASLSWQTLLAGIGALARGRISERAQTAAIIFGNVVVLVLALVILMREPAS